MDGAIAAWAGVVLGLFIAIIGWGLLYTKGVRDQSRAFGRLEQKVDGLCTAVRELNSALPTELRDIRDRLLTLENHEKEHRERLSALEVRVKKLEGG